MAECTCPVGWDSGCPVHGDGKTDVATDLERALYENQILRKMLWLRHASHFEALYGDDGEMSCNRCMIDFRRQPAESIREVFTKQGIAALAEDFRRREENVVKFEEKLNEL